MADPRWASHVQPNSTSSSRKTPKARSKSKNLSTPPTAAPPATYFYPCYSPKSTSLLTIEAASKSASDGDLIGADDARLQRLPSATVPLQSIANDIVALLPRLDVTDNRVVVALHQMTVSGIGDIVKHAPGGDDLLHGGPQVRPGTLFSRRITEFYWIGRTDVD